MGENVKDETLTFINSMSQQHTALIRDLFGKLAISDLFSGREMLK